MGRSEPPNVFEMAILIFGESTVMWRVWRSVASLRTPPETLNNNKQVLVVCNVIGPLLNLQIGTVACLRIRRAAACLSKLSPNGLHSGVSQGHEHSPARVRKRTSQKRLVVMKTPSCCSACSQHPRAPNFAGRRPHLIYLRLISSHVGISLVPSDVGASPTYSVPTCRAAQPQSHHNSKSRSCNHLPARKAIDGNGNGPVHPSCLRLINISRLCV